VFPKSAPKSNGPDSMKRRSDGEEGFSAWASCDPEILDPTKHY
jgi:hypothetical protein